MTTQPVLAETKAQMFGFIAAIAGASFLAIWTSSSPYALYRAGPERRPAAASSRPYFGDLKLEKFSRASKNPDGSPYGEGIPTQVRSYGSPGVASFSSMTGNGNCAISTSIPIASRF